MRIHSLSTNASMEVLWVEEISDRNEERSVAEPMAGRARIRGKFAKLE